MSDRYGLARLLEMNARSNERCARALVEMRDERDRAQERVDRARELADRARDRVSTCDDRWRRGDACSAQALRWHESQRDRAKRGYVAAERALERAIAEHAERDRAFEKIRAALTLGLERARVLREHHQAWLAKRARARLALEENRYEDAVAYIASARRLEPR